MTDAQMHLPGEKEAFVTATVTPEGRENFQTPPEAATGTRPLADIQAERDRTANSLKSLQDSLAQDAESAKVAQGDNLQSRLNEAYLKFTGGGYTRGVLLNELRDSLSDLPRSEQDRAFREAQTRGGSLMPMDNRLALSRMPETQAASIKVGGEDRHILWLDKEAEQAAGGGQQHVPDPEATAEVSRLQGHLDSLDQELAQANQRQQPTPGSGSAPERVTTAAIKVGQQTFTGTDHSAALQSALQAGVPEAEVYAAADAGNDGFVTSSGRFVNRQEAGRIGNSAGQMVPGNSNERFPTLGAMAHEFQEGELHGVPRLMVDEDALSRAVNSAVDDQKALIKYGSWDAAVANGHTFGGEDHIPWQFTSGENTGNAETSLDAFTARVRDSFRSQYDDAKGGAVQTDAMNQAAVEARVKLWNEDPQALLGALTAAGKRAGDLRADMQASFTVAQRLMQDSWTMASRIKMGLLDEWGGSQEAAYAALKQQVGVTAQAHSAALSISSNAGRALRGLRADQKLTPQAVAAVNSLGPRELGNLGNVDGADLVDLLTETKGDPMAMAAALKPRLIQTAVEGGQLFLVNNLISNPITHAIIFGSNLWQAAARPLMRMGGSLANGTWDTVGKEAAKSYWYMGTAVPDALNMAYKAFQLGDSVIAPHDLSSAMGAGSGGSATASSIGQAIAQAPFKSWDSVGNIFSNTMLAMAKTGTFPTRLVGMQDELVKQVVYRGKVLANAAVEGTQQGLKGADLEAFMKSKLYDSFDQYGQATDKFALQEAKVATYQNELNPTGSFGWATQGYALQKYLQNNPAARIIVPFLRTPVNLFRQGVQLTPGLNLLQAEYREALSGVPIQGETAEQAAFRQAQALGQMGIGALIMGSVGLLAYQGMVTGDVPSNSKLAAEAMADGWRPNSLVIPHRDGSRTYIPFDRYDPVMMPFAMAANIVSVLKSPEMADQNKAESMLRAVTLALIKQITNKLYLQSLKQTLDVAADPDRTFGKWAGGLAGNYVPFSSALHLINPDPVMRDAHDFMSTMLGKVPGFSKDFPARRDWAGDPVTVHKGLWLDAPGDKANQEVERLALQQGASVGAPSSRTKGEADLRDITLAGNADPQGKGMNAYDRFQELAGHPERMPGGNPMSKPLRQAATELINSSAYQKMPDGDPGTKGTKVATLMGLVNSYREGARKFMAADNNVRAKEYEETLRVAKANGYVTPNMPTPTNTADGLINRLGKMFGFSGAHAPSLATPTTQGAPAP